MQDLILKHDDKAWRLGIVLFQVDNVGRNSRSYSGSGIYRNVHLTLTQPVHIAIWGVDITTPEIKRSGAVIDVEVTSKNENEKEVRAQITINVKDKDGQLAGTAKENFVLPGRTDRLTKKQIEVKNPVLWSIESPDLYTAEIIIEADKKVTDTYIQPFFITYDSHWALPVFVSP